MTSHERIQVKPYHAQIDILDVFRIYTRRAEDQKVLYHSISSERMVVIVWI